MHYIRSNLLQGERIIAAIRPHWVVFLWPAFLAICAVVFPIYLQTALFLVDQLTVFGMPLYQAIAWLLGLLAALYGLQSYILYQTSEYGITDKRIVMKTGWIKRRSVELFLEKIEAIYVDQSICGRLLNYGTLVISGTGGTRDPFLYVPNPLAFRRRIQQQINIVLRK